MSEFRHASPSLSICLGRFNERLTIAPPQKLRNTNAVNAAGSMEQKDIHAAQRDGGRHEGINSRYKLSTPGWRPVSNGTIASRTSRAQVDDWLASRVTSRQKEKQGVRQCPSGVPAIGSRLRSTCPRLHRRGSRKNMSSYPALGQPAKSRPRVPLLSPTWFHRRRDQRGK